MADLPEAASAAPTAGFSLETAWTEASTAQDPAPSEPTPAEPTPTPDAERADAPTPDATEHEEPQAPQDTSPDQDQAPAEPPADEKADAKPQGSRRERGEQLRTQIEAEVRAEYEARQARERAEAEAARQADEAQRRDAELQQAREQLAADTATLLNPNATWEEQQAARERSGPLFERIQATEVSERLRNEGRQAALTEFWAHQDQQLLSLEGMTPETVKTLLQVPSAIDYAKHLVSHGRTLEQQAWADKQAEWEQQIAARDAEIQALKGKLAGKTSSPEGATGLRTAAAPPEITSLEDAWRLASARAEGVA